MCAADGFSHDHADVNHLNKTGIKGEGSWIKAGGSVERINKV